MESVVVSRGFVGALGGKFAIVIFKLRLYVLSPISGVAFYFAMGGVIFNWLLCGWDFRVEPGRECLVLAVGWRRSECRKSGVVN